jgi:hypothetical protein
MYTDLGAVISDFTCCEFIYFLYNLGMDYYDGLGVMSDEEWQTVFCALKDNYVLYEVEKEIDYRELRARMAAVLNKTFYKHRSAYDVMMDALSSFDQGDRSVRLKHLIRSLEESEALAREFAAEDAEDGE